MGLPEGSDAREGDRRLVIGAAGRWLHQLLSHPHRVLVVIGLSMALVIAAQARFAAGPTSGWAMAFWALGLAIACWVLAPAARRVLPVERVRTMPLLQAPRGGWQTARTFLPAGLTAVAMAAIWCAQTYRAREASRWDLIPVWLLSMVGAVLVVWRPPVGGVRAAIASWWSRNRREGAIMIGLAVGAGLLTCLRLGTFPWIFNSDEGGFSLVSVQMVSGRFRDPFATGFLGHPTLYNAMQASAIGVFGRSIAATRILSALLGASCAPLAYAVARRWSRSRSAGVVAAVLLATFETHLFWSRSALPNIASEFFVLLVVLLLDRALEAGTPTTWLMLGVAVGASQYFYFSNRLLGPIVVIAIIVCELRSIFNERDRRDATTLGARRLLLVVCGFAVTVLPMLAFYYRTPERLAERERLVSVFTDGWLRHQAATHGWSPVHLIWDQFVTAAMLPFRTTAHGFYRRGVPFVGWPMAVFGALGLALVTLRAGHRRLIAPVVIFWATVAGMAVTRGPAETNRWVMAIPLFCVFAGVGLMAVADTVATAAPTTRRFVAAVAGFTVVVAASLSLHAFFSDDDRIDVYSDTNTEVAEHLAREVLAIDPTATVYFSGSPRMWYRGFGDLVFRTPNVTAIDLDAPWSAATRRPVITATTIFVVLPERADELTQLRAWFPNVRSYEIRYHGVLLYTSITVQPADVVHERRLLPGPPVTDDQGRRPGTDRRLRR